MDWQMTHSRSIKFSSRDSWLVVMLNALIWNKSLSKMKSCNYVLKAINQKAKIRSDQSFFTMGLNVKDRTLTCLLSG
jgi:hypothetical protein